MYLIVGLIVFMNFIKDLSWEWEPRKMKKMSSMKRLQKLIRWRKVRIIYKPYFFPRIVQSMKYNTTPRPSTL